MSAARVVMATLAAGIQLGVDGDDLVLEVAKYLETLKKYPNPPSPNITKF